MADISKITDLNGVIYDIKDDVARTDITGKEDKINKVTAISSSSTDAQYPTAKCVYDIVGDIEAALFALR